MCDFAVTYAVTAVALTSTECAGGPEVRLRHAIPLIRDAAHPISHKIGVQTALRLMLYGRVAQAGFGMDFGTLLVANSPYLGADPLMPPFLIRPELRTYERGSRFARIRMHFTPQDGIDFLSGVCASLVAAAIIGLATPAGTENVVRMDAPEGTWFVCSVGLEVGGDRDRIFDRAADELELHAEADAEARRRIVQGRQMCLAAAGFSPGPIDGVSGELTKAAERAFVAHHGLERFAWESHFARRFLVETAHQRHAERARTLGDPDLEIGRRFGSTRGD